MNEMSFNCHEIEIFMKLGMILSFQCSLHP